MECIIVMRTNNGTVLVVTNDDDEPIVFDHRDAAISALEINGHWSSMLSQIVELDEL